MTTNYVMFVRLIIVLLDFNKAYSGILTVGTFFGGNVDSLLEGPFEGFLVGPVISELMKPFYNYSLFINSYRRGFVSILHFASQLLI